jgi:hypothetical protein
MGSDRNRWVPAYGVAPATHEPIMTPFGGAVFVLFLPFIVFRLGHAVWDICYLRYEWRVKQTARRVERELDCYGQRGTVAQEFAELMAARSA